MRRTWIKLYVDQCLRGSMIEELTPAQRWLWFGLLLMAGDSSIPGVIFRRRDENGILIGFSDITIAETLDVDIDTYRDGIRRMIEKNKITVDARGVIFIVNWNKYQSEYQRQKPYREDGYKKGSNQGDDVDVDGDVDGDVEKEDIADLIPGIIKTWNEFAKDYKLPKLMGIPAGSTRQKSLLARLKDPAWNFKSILEAIPHQPFLLGDNDDGWLVDFDFILKPSKYIKILEGCYRKDVRGRAKDRQPDDPYVGARRKP